MNELKHRFLPQVIVCPGPKITSVVAQTPDTLLRYIMFSAAVSCLLEPALEDLDAKIYCQAQDHAEAE